jgi:hypothetical protein
MRSVIGGADREGGAEVPRRCRTAVVIFMMVLQANVRIAQPAKTAKVTKGDKTPATPECRRGWPAGVRAKIGWTARAVHGHKWQPEQGRDGIAGGQDAARLGQVLLPVRW